MKSKLISNLSANTLQLIINQLLGLCIFYVLSTSLSKEDFGTINLALAVLLVIFNILSFGIDQLVIKKIAAGDDQKQTLSLFITHVLITGSLFYGILLIGYYLLHNASQVYMLILLIGLGKLMIYFSTPLKQAASGLELFKLLAYMLVISNLIRCICLVICIVFNLLNLSTVVTIFIIADAVELNTCIVLFRRSAKIPLNLNFNKASYIQLLYDALPQTGVVIITSALARFDWIFIGFFLSTSKLAEYSFAYKIFEMATLPLLAIAPLLIPHFTKIFKQSDIPERSLELLIRLELIIASLIVLILNICWSPLIDPLTAGKYGSVNVNTIFILSLCMPLLYLNNFLWTIYFAKGQLKMVLNSFVIAFLINLIADIILIPIFKNEGAAFAFLLACLAQTVFYLIKNDVRSLGNTWGTAIICTGCALFAGITVKVVFSNTIIELLASIMFYGLLLLITRQIKLNDRPNFKAIINW